MDIFRFHSPTSPTKLEQGEIVNGLSSIMWVERYLAAGEFSIKADADSEVRTKLPIGSFISHTETTELMIVENHEISDSRGKKKEIVITGRGFETVFEQRIVGMNQTFPVSTGILDYILASAESWDQAVELINDHVLAADLIDDDNAIPYLTVMTDITDVGTSVERSLKRGTLYQSLMELLSVDGLGIKAIRPGPWLPVGVPSDNIAVVIHKGVDRSDQIIFSYDTGEIESADYLWSNKKLKNAALISGKWVETWVDTAETGYERRVMHVEASDIDNAYSEAPTGVDLDNVVAAMQARGTAALAAQNDVALTKAEVHKDDVQSTYRVDFEVGDIITVSGDYNETSTMRISEYVEIEDETGNSRYPTLSMI